jgi:SAM-dependent methyltransferase
MIACLIRAKNTTLSPLELESLCMMLEELHRRIAAIDESFPFPESERRRTKMRQWILQFGSLGEVGAEIGVFRGHYSEILLRTLRPRKMYLVDPWTMLGEFYGNWGPYTNEGTLPTSLAREDAQLRVQQFPNSETIFIEDKFPACLRLITEKLDWIYLDASHGYEATLKELEVIDEILAPGGIIFGDDWHSDRSHPHHGVFRGVNEFVGRSNYEVVAAGPALQWCIRRVGEYP